MPMPEIEDYTISELQDRGDGFKDFDLNIGEVERLMNDCYDAGKADALPPWPPVDGYYENYKLVNGFTLKAYKHGVPVVHFFKDRWHGLWGTLEEEVQVQLTAAYFRGELEEVK